MEQWILDVKGKGRPRTGHKKTEGEFISTLSLTSALNGGGWPTPRPRPLYPRKRKTVLIVEEAGWAPGSVWTGVENLAPNGFFLCVFSFFRSVLFIHCVPLYPLSCHLLLYNTHNISMHPGGIQTRNPSRRSAADPRTGIDYGFAPRTVQPTARRYTDWAIPNHEDGREKTEKTQTAVHSSEL
jgi:hypothetical protein